LRGRAVSTVREDVGKFVVSIYNTTIASRWVQCE
jgi:hypothetical protein